MNKYDYKFNSFKRIKSDNDTLFYIKINNEFIEINKQVYKILKNNYEYVKYHHNKEVKHGVITTDNIDAFTSFCITKSSMNITKYILLKDVISIIINKINKMDFRNKFISYLIFFKNHSDRQTAKILNIPQTTVSYRKRRIQKILQEKILEYCSYEDLFQQ